MINSEMLDSNSIARQYYKDRFQDFPIPERTDSLYASNRKFETGRKKLLNICKDTLPKETSDYVDLLFQENSSVSFYNNLLSYAKSLDQSDESNTKLKIMYFSLEFFKFSKLFGFMESRKNINQEALNFLWQEIEFFKVNTFSFHSLPYIKWKIPLEKLLKIAKISLKKQSSKNECITYATSLKSLIDLYLKEGPSNHLSGMFFTQQSIKTVKEKTVGNFPVNVWVKNTHNGIALLSEPLRRVKKASYDYGTAYKAFEMFIPFDATPSQEFPIQRVLFFMGKKESKSKVLQEIANLEKMERSTSKITSWEPIPTIYSKESCVLTKSEGIDSLSLEMKNNSCCLSILDLLNICQDISNKIKTLSESDLVHLKIEIRSIFFIKEANKEARGFIHNMLNLTPKEINSPTLPTTPWLNTLAQKGHISTETNCFSLMHLINHLFFESQLSENFLFDALQKNIPPPHYETILALKEQFKDSPDDFAEALLIFAANISPTIEDQYFVLLRQLAFNTAIFPLLKDLIDKTFQADKQHKIELEKFSNTLSNEEFSSILALEPKIPSLQKIQRTLRESIFKIYELENRALHKYSPYPNSTIDPTQIQEMLNYILPSASDSDKTIYENLWQNSLTKCLISPEWIEHNQIRLHKKEEGLPFSFSIQKGVEGIWIKAFPLHFLANNSGAYKKVKLSLKFFLPKIKDLTPPLLPLSTVIYRVDDYNIATVLASYVTHQALMQIEGSEAYFVPRSTACRSYLGTRGWKWESESPWYNGTLNQIIQSARIQEKIHSSIKRPIKSSDMIQCLIKTALGIEFLGLHNIFHKDIKGENILIKINDKGVLDSHIADFDLTSFEHSHSLRTDYYCWDFLCTQGFASQYTDYYSLNIIIAESLLPSFLLTTNQYPSKGKKAFYKRLSSNPQTEKKELLKKHIEDLKHQLDKKGQDLLDLFLDPNQIDLTEARTAILKYAKELEAQGSYYRTLYLQKLVMTTLFLDDVFELITKTFKADQRSQSYMETHPTSEATFQKTAKTALEQAGFPTIDEFKSLLFQCQSIAFNVESQYNDLPLNHLP